jgi:hypothetical protein
VITGADDARPEVALLLTLLQEAQESVSADTLRRWVRLNDERALKLLIAQDFAAFEDALAELRERGLVISRRASDASRPATSP